LITSKNILILIILYFIPVIFQGSFAQDVMPVGKMTEIFGDVKITRKGEKITPQKSAIIYLKDKIETGTDSLSKIVFIDGSSIEIASESNLEINEFIYNPQERKGLFKVLQGKIKSEIKKIEDRDSNVEFQTRNAVAGVKGTVLYINADDDFFSVRVGTIYVRGLYPGSKTVYVSGGYYTRLVNGVPIVPKVMTQAMWKQFDDIFDYRRYLPPEVNEVIRKSPFKIKKPKFFD